ncbi:MAG: hypothetical protein IT324_17155 [Anaerolineae bacterium]|nr:hypothetical protein [Anaerolineae bacterium]
MNATPAPRMNFYPLYSEVSELMHLLDGQRRDALYSMMKTIYENRGTPQANNDWSEPEQWIPEILVGAEREMALYIWRTSEGRLSPRYLGHVLRFCFIHELLEEDRHGMLRITAHGNDYLENRNVELIM